MEPNRRSPCSFSTRPKPAPILHRAPKPSRHGAGGPIARSDKSPIQMALRTPKSNRRPYRPIDRRYMASSCVIPQPRAAARHSRNRRFRARRRTVPASDKKCRKKPSNAFRKYHEFFEQFAAPRSASPPEHSLRRRQPLCPPALFHGPPDLPAVARDVVFRRPDARPRDALAPAVLLPPSSLRRIVVFGRKQKTREPRQAAQCKTFSL